ncbi:MAG: potassium transporter Kup [Steroidobacteraceae bacterium]|nr:potassium transporter Kup [Steroidobacteraceae bacterium]
MTEATAAGEGTTGGTGHGGQGPVVDASAVGTDSPRSASPVQGGNGHAGGHHPVGPLPKLALGALGIVFGDIGTSPLYALRASINASGDAASEPVVVLGVLSLIFWAILLVVTVKYVAVVLRTDNRGEGGVLALTALVVTEGRVQRPLLVAAFGLMGCALFYGDGAITPAVTVLSAIEGLEIVSPAFQSAVVPLALAVLIVLFAIQKRGTGAIGAMFGPVMLVWFATLGALGALSIAQTPGVLLAVNPAYAVEFFATHPGVSLVVLGSVFLAVTGGEALYADLGHFGRRPIRAAWFAVVWPGLLLNYFGQGALLLRDPTAIENPFYLLAPTWFLVPLVLLATAASIIASQAVISGVFSITQQGQQLGFLPRMKIAQTSDQAIGQVYVPSINWILFTTCVGLVLVFRSSDALANAYGIAVASTMVIETFVLVMLLRGRVTEGVANPWSFLLLIPLFLVDLAFFAANVLKIPNGGWFPLVFGGAVFVTMRTWMRGRLVVSEQMRRQERPVDGFLDELARNPPARVPGTAVFLSGNPENIPRTLARNVRYNGVLHEHTVLLSVITERIPRVSRGNKLRVVRLSDSLWRVEVRIGFMERADVPRLLREAERLGLGFRTDTATYFLGRDDIVVASPRGMARWRKHLFLFMARNSEFAGAHFGIPHDRIIELGGQVQI